jgi:hypothetical protein
LATRQSRVVGIKENVETVGWPGAIKIDPVGVHRLDIPSLPCGNNKVIGKIRAKGGKISKG